MAEAIEDKSGHFRTLRETAQAGYGLVGCGAVIIINTNQEGPDAEAAIRELTGNLVDWARVDFH